MGSRTSIASSPKAASGSISPARIHPRSHSPARSLLLARSATLGVSPARPASAHHGHPTPALLGRCDAPHSASRVLVGTVPKHQRRCTARTLARPLAVCVSRRPDRDGPCSCSCAAVTCARQRPFQRWGRRRDASLLGGLGRGSCVRPQRSSRSRASVPECADGRRHPEL